MTFAHVGGAPIEEALLPLTSGASAALLLARAWIASRVPFKAMYAASIPSVSSQRAKRLGRMNDRDLPHPVAPNRNTWDDVREEGFASASQP